MVFDWLVFIGFLGLGLSFVDVLVFCVLVCVWVVCCVLVFAVC